MPKRPNLEDHAQSLDAHKKSAADLEAAKSTYNLAADLRQEASPEEREAAEAMLVEAKADLERVREQYKNIIDKAREAGDIHSEAANLELWLEAYQEQYRRLENQLTGLKSDIDSYKAVLEQEASQTEKANRPQMPEWVEEKLSNPAAYPRVKYLFKEFLAHDLAKLAGMAPEGGFSEEQIDDLWRRALKRYLTELPGAVKPAMAVAPFTGWEKGRAKAAGR